MNHIIFIYDGEREPIDEALVFEDAAEAEIFEDEADMDEITPNWVWVSMFSQTD